MEKLKSIIKLVSTQKIKQIDLITEKVNPKNKADLLYQAIRDDRVETDEEAINLIYGDKKGPQEAYKKLKYRLKERIINTVFFIDIQNYSRSPHEKASIRVMKNYAAAKILKSYGLINIPQNLLESTIKSCIQFDFLEYKVLIFSELKKRYGLYKFDQRKYNKYKKWYKEALDHKILRDEIEEFYTILARKVTVSKNLSYNEEIKSIEEKFMPLYSRSLEIDDFNTRYYAYNSLYFLLMYKDDIELQSQVCDEALAYFETKKGFSKKPKFSFNQKKGLYFLAIGKYSEAVTCFDNCLSCNPRVGSISWQYIYNYKFSAAILENKFSEAYLIISKVMNNKAFKKISKEFQQPWYIKEAYIHFLIKTNRINPDEIDVKPLRKFRLTRFLNEVPDFSKDKKGANITINIIQLLFFVLEKNYDKVADRLTALSHYSQRYLKPKEFIRPRTFIKLLHIANSNIDNKTTLLSKAEKHLRTLQSNPIPFTEQSSQTEIIPYEELWKQLMEEI